MKIPPRDVLPGRLQSAVHPHTVTLVPERLHQRHVVSEDHKMPKGGMFDIVSSPQFLHEIVLHASIVKWTERASEPRKCVRWN
ncbi:hypothetical protein MAR_007263 [Mya arenaria]|uniref:Uncharacterized protein n=1 Tax=Mya arenaria TaxID=6604 RepID=A0ABY7DAV1_MYAAR|nr:hypothetical protein MAR_007263 [Mya arenaria]